VIRPRCGSDDSIRPSGLDTAFHHGAQLQTGIKRPKFLEFEDAGGILPAHTVGMWLSGRQRLSLGKLGYDVYAGNGPSIRRRIPPCRTPACSILEFRAPSVAASRWWESEPVRQPLDDALTFGVHGLTTEVKDTAALSNVTRVIVLGAWATYLTDKWEVMLEGYHFRDAGPQRRHGIHTSHAGYAQIGRSIGPWTPYARYELTSLDQTDNYFASSNRDSPTGEPCSGCASISIHGRRSRSRVPEHAWSIGSPAAIRTARPVCGALLAYENAHANRPCHLRRY